MGRKPLAKSRLKRPDKQREIVLSLTEFFKVRRLSDTNMEDVAQYLNKSKATIYKYFRSKEQIVEAIIDTKINEISNFAIILRNEEIDFFKRYQMSYELLASHIADISNELLADLQTLYPSIYRKIEVLIDLAVRELRLYYEEGMNRGIFNRLNSGILAQNDLMFFQLLTNPEFLLNNQITMEQAFADFYKIRCFGLLRQ
jgi:AcrR family transcriptional regulator